MIMGEQIEFSYTRLNC